MSMFFEKPRLSSKKRTRWARLRKPFYALAQLQMNSGVLLMVMTVIALLIANSPLNDGYQQLLHQHIKVSLNQYQLDLSLHHWVNDALMAIFFYLVGLEIKKEVLVGSLSSFDKALLPMVAALGGMLVPAMVFTAFNVGGAGIDGWGVPMATDIAFALAVLILLGNRVPSALTTLLLALAIVDDLGAVLVIAFFYTESLDWNALWGALSCFAVLLILNRAGVRTVWLYFLLAVLMWVFMLHSGVHATIAGVLGALATPSRSLWSPQAFAQETRRWLHDFEHKSTQEGDFENSLALNHCLDELRRGIAQAQPPAEYLTHRVHTPVYFWIIPLFVLFNAGVRLEWSQLGNLGSSPVVLGVALGLLLGKFVGVFGVVYVGMRYRWLRLPEGINLQHIVGMAMLSSIGFTMSIFVAELAYREQPWLLTEAKIAILAASVFAGVMAYLYLYALGGKRE